MKLDVRLIPIDEMRKISKKKPLQVKLQKQLSKIIDKYWSLLL